MMKSDSLKRIAKFASRTICDLRMASVWTIVACMFAFAVPDNASALDECTGCPFGRDVVSCEGENCTACSASYHEDIDQWSKTISGDCCKSIGGNEVSCTYCTEWSGSTLTCPPPGGE
jgi:hypothetical protein